MPDILNQINWIDIVFLILLLGMVYKGLKTGVGGQVIALIGWFVLVFISLKYYSVISEALFGFLLQKWAKPLSFFVIAAGIFMAIKLLERVFNIMSGEDLAPIEKIMGAVVAVLRASIFCGVIGILLLLVPVDRVHTAAKEGSKTCMFFVKMDAQIYTLLANVAGNKEKTDKEEVLANILENAGTKN
ncbi:MAG: CvpA family protein [Candidatus Tantalella remota]|nr:CvpA family protein [Candidatus Tantalella remota]